MVHGLVRKSLAFTVSVRRMLSLLLISSSFLSIIKLVWERQTERDEFDLLSKIGVIRERGSYRTIYFNISFFQSIVNFLEPKNVFLYF